ncbi:MAG: glycogen synthase GlgA [Firmicutes bacterium]|nr:glycogen synthase GlgA [Bacillota bacterium]
MSDSRCLKVLVVSSEVAPYAKSGGLGDVAGSLPSALKKEGVDVRVVLPKYKAIRTDHFIGAKFLGDYMVSLSWRKQKAGILEKSGDIKTYFIENDYYFGRDGFYGYDDDNERFAFFCRAVLDMLNFIDFYPDIIHCNDWQTGPLPMFLNENYKKFVYYKNIRTLFTVHNLQYQGRFSRESMEMLDVPPYCFENMEFYGQISFMKAGLMYADMISTVSKTYAEEIKTFQYGYGMDGILRHRSGRLCGILNGIDFEQNNPETDDRIEINYSIDTLEKKRENKALLQKQLCLDQRDVPVISVISRLADQKGFDLLAWISEQMLNYDIQFIVLGTGERRLEDFFRTLEWRYPKRVSANILFDDTLAQRIYASSDMFVMPSLFEPCGLGQMFSLRYGTVPIVRKTGGLSDTVTHYNSDTKEGNGFVFEHYTADGLMWAIREALEVYNKGWNEWKNVVRNAMMSNNSWSNSAKEYVALYNKIKKQ